MITEKEFINSWVQKLTGNFKQFPDDFLNSENTKSIIIPPKSLVIGQEFFGSIEVTSTDASFILHAESYEEAKYLVYASRRKSETIVIPLDFKEMVNAVKEYEQYLNSVMKNIEYDYRNVFPLQKNSSFVINEIFRILNILRY